MTFLFPLGFLALLAIPVLILIYIIKNRYTEQTVTSTYLWTLSERFLRRRIPINRLTGIISLILQILAVILIALIVAHPILSVRNGADEYCFILDGSGSMHIEQNGSTRFDEGKKKITDIINKSMNGSTYTIICVGETVYKSNTFTDKELAFETLERLEVSYIETSPSDALTLANTYFNQHPASSVYLITDRTYTNTENVTVISMADATKNYGVADVTYLPSGETLKISGYVTSYGSDVDKLTLEVYFSSMDESTGEASELELSDKFTVENIVADEPAPFEYICKKGDFVSFKLRIVEDDDMAVDNEIIVYNVSHENIADTIIVYPMKPNEETGNLEDQPPNLLIWSLKAAGNTRITAVTDRFYKSMADKSGFGLSIFYSCVPDEMPRDGAVWFINPPKTVPGGNFSFQGEVSARGTAQFSTSKNTSVQKMLEGVIQTGFELDKYSKLGINGSFIEYIRCDGNPLLATGTNVYGNREVVCAFDLGASGPFTLHLDCLTIMRHLLSYSFPEVLEQTSFYCGDTLQVNILSGCVGLRIDTPLGKSVYPDISTAVSEYQLNEAGIYTVHLVMKDNSERDLYVYASLPLAERELTVAEPIFAVNGIPSDDKVDGIIDNLLIIFIILAVISVADYGVYCYEQYQLR